jgi:signal transduction histidine kinase
MTRLLGRFKSARARLIFWNTLVFALVLVTVGAVFRVLAERSLVAALDREMRLQGQRFRDKQRIEMIVLTGSGPKPLPDLAVEAHAKMLRFSTSRATTQYRVVENFGVRAPDRSDQFLYRSFDLKGKPLSPLEEHLPIAGATIERVGGEDGADRRADYRPWDATGFAEALRGRERIREVESAGTRLRVFSAPLLHGQAIVGAVQIAAPLAQLTRDLAGLTRALLLVLPLALLIAVAAGIFLTDRALRPVQALTRAAAGIRPDQLSRRLPVSGADEFDTLAATFNQALARVESAFADRERAISQLRRFTADASHELRTPLTTIKTNAGVALTDVEPSAEHVHALRQIDRAADRMTALVQDLLLLARSDARQLSLDLRPVALPDVLRDAIDSVAQTPRASIVLECHEPIPCAHGDYEHLRRLFLNLLQNAARHTPPEGRIAAGVEATEAGVVVTISDTGCGIAPEHLPHIGQPFYRVDAGRDRMHGGAGLGLAICRSIADAHSAALAVDSSPGRGVRVTVAFPAAPPFRTLSDLPAKLGA